MPQYFNEAVNTVNNNDAARDEAPANEANIEINQLQRTFEPSYNIPPTRASLIIYKTKENSAKYILEPLSFGLLPFWAKPNDETPVSRQGESGPKYSKEIQGFAGRFFNCRKESLELPVWKSARHNRCVVPIEGYFEWQKSKIDKVPYYVYSNKRPLVFLAGFYSHNTNYTGKDPEYADSYLSTFTILTGPAQLSDIKDISWLHPRKPLMLLPGTKAWDDWLDPNKEWSNKLIETCLETKKNTAYIDLTWHTVSKSIGNPGYNTKDATSKVKSGLPQKSISLFFLPTKRTASEGSPKKRIKTEDRSSVKLESEQKDKKDNDNDEDESEGKKSNEEAKETKVKQESN